MKHYGLTISEGSEVTNLTAPTGTTFPGAESVGELFLRTDNSRLYVWDGTQWRDITAGAFTDADLLDGLDSLLFARSDIDDEIAGKYKFTDTTEVTLSTNGAITIGENSSVNLSLDTNEIQARNNGTFSTLNLNEHGGPVNIGTAGSAITMAGAVTAGTLSVTTINGGTPLTSLDEGTGNGLDADTVDGIEGASFIRSDENDETTGKITFNKGSGGSWARFRDSDTTNEMTLLTSSDNRFIMAPAPLGVGDYGKELHYSFTDERWTFEDQLHIHNPIAPNARLSFSDSTTTNSPWIGANGDELLLQAPSGTHQVTVSDNLIVTGDLTVSGTTTYIDTNTLNIGDNIITLNADETGAPSQNAGIEIERGTSTNVLIFWNETINEWQATNGISANTILTAADEGTGNGLDADTLDTYHAASFLRKESNNVITGQSLTIQHGAPIFVLDETEDTNGNWNMVADGNTFSIRYPDTGTYPYPLSITTSGGAANEVQVFGNRVLTTADSSDVVDDTTPQLGGDLDVNGFNIVGTPAATATSNGGPVTVTAGGGGATNGNGGSLTLSSGAGTGGYYGGDVSLTAGTGGKGGELTIKAGTSDDGEAGGNLFIDAGAGDTGETGGLTRIRAGQGGLNAAGGQLQLHGGGTTGTGTGGAVSIYGGTSQNGDGGDIYITGGNTTSSTGGNLVLRSGEGEAPGQIYLQPADTGSVNISASAYGTGAVSPLRFFEGWGGSQYVALKAPTSITTNRTWTLPQDDPSTAAGKVLTTDASGVLSFIGGAGSGLDADTLDGLDSSVFSKRIFRTTNVGATPNQWSKVATATIPGIYQDANIIAKIYSEADGSAVMYAEDLMFSVKQQAAFGNDPLIYLKQFRVDETTFDFGYVIVQNTPNTIVDLYCKNTSTHRFCQAFSQAVDDNIVFYDQSTLITTEPAGIVYGDKNVYLHTGNDGSYLRSDEYDEKTSGSIRFYDNVNLQIGTDADTRHYWDGTNYITDIHGGSWYIRDGDSGPTTRFQLAIGTGNMYIGGELTVGTTSASGAEGGQINFTKAPNGTMTSNPFIDIVNDTFRMISYPGGDVSALIFPVVDGSATVLTTADVTGILENAELSKYIYFNDYDDALSANTGLKTYVRDGTWNINKNTGETNDPKILINGDQVLTTSTGVSLTGDDIISGNKEFNSTDTTGNYANSAIELREVGRVGAAQSADAYAPALAFHWGSRTQAQIALESDARIHFRSGVSPHTTDRNIECGSLFPNGHVYIKDNLCMYLGTGSDIKHFWNGSNYYTDFDTADTNWYIRNVANTNQFTFNVSAGSFTATGNVTVGYGKASSYLYMHDSDHTTRIMHCNSDQIGFLNSSGGWGAYCTNSGQWNVAGDISARNIKPNSDNIYDLGNASARWDDIYATNNVIQTSDARLKDNILDLNQTQAVALLENVRPVTFKWKDYTTEEITEDRTVSIQTGVDEDGQPIYEDTIVTDVIQEGKVHTHARTHTGLIAQEFEQALIAVGLDPDTYAGFIHDVESDTYGVRYTELISPMISVIQKLLADNTAKQTQLDEQAALLAAMDARLTALEV